MKKGRDIHSAKGGDDVDDDVIFLRQFAAQIGAALREREDDENDVGSPEQRRQRNQPNITESVEDLYHSLSFDDPIIDHITNLPLAASALSRQLVASSAAASPSSSPSSSSSSSSTYYALSNRFVNGVLFLCQRQKTKEISSLHEPPRLTTASSSSSACPHSPASIAMAKLAFTIFIQVPLECWRVEGNDNGMVSIRTLLGSYKGITCMGADDKCRDNNNNQTRDGDVQRNNLDGDNSPQDAQQQSREVMNGTHSKSSSDDDDDQNIARYQAGEVITNVQQDDDDLWAAESDPSDYDFGEGTLSVGQHHPLMEQQWPEEDWLDPRVLSRPDPDLTIEQANHAIATLLQLASYTLLEPIFSLSKQEVIPFISQLTQLTLLLLQPGSSSLISTTIRSRSMDNAILAPLWILRDAATFTDDSATRQSFASYYLEVLQTLLAVDQAHLQDLGGSTALRGTAASAVDLCVASIVGLSALSSWCAMDRSHTPLTIDAVVDSMNDLTHVVERAIAGGTSNANLSNTLIPIFEILSGVYYDQVDKVRPTKSSIPQTLLNSGFLRQILVLAMEPDSPHASQIPIHHALWGLCISYPTTVGKYVFGFPGVADLLLRQYVIKHDVSSSAQYCVQAILWNMYGWLQCGEASSSSTAPKVVWKSKLSQSKPLSRDECKEVCLKAWSRLCEIVQESLEHACSNSGADGIGGTNIDNDIAERAIREWGRLLVFATIPAISAIFDKLIDSTRLEGVSKVLTNLPKLEENGDLSNLGGAEHDRESDDKKKSKTSRRQHFVAEAHKSLKEYKLCFQGAVSRSSKMD